MYCNIVYIYIYTEYMRILLYRVPLNGLYRALLGSVVIPSKELLLKVVCLHALCTMKTGHDCDFF